MEIIKFLLLIAGTVVVTLVLGYVAARLVSFAVCKSFYQAKREHENENENEKEALQWLKMNGKKD